MIGFAQSALNQTQVEIRLSCVEENVDMVFQVEYALRSSPCDKEFFDAKRADNLRKLLDSHGSIIFSEPDPHPMTVKNVTILYLYLYIHLFQNCRFSSWNPAQTIPADGIYFLVMKIIGVSYPSSSPSEEHNITITVKWKQPHGFLSAIDYPLLRFYVLMCVFYGTLAIIWMILCIKYYKDILRIQYWIGAVIILGMIEKAFFLAEYSTMNTTGRSVEGILELAELVSCAKRTMSRVLVIIVSVGYGVVKPRLGNTLSQVAGVGLVYFVFCAIEGLARVSKNHVEAAKQKQFAALPLVITEMVIFYWIFTSLGATMRTLKLRRNEVKLTVYRHFMNTLMFAAIASVIFMIWIIVILWRPSVNNQRYAFTPLLDDSEDENDQDEIFNASAPGFEMLKQRESGSGADMRRQKEKEREDHKLQDDLRWIEDHIPSSLAEHLIMDEDEDKEARDLEISKML
ncbi:unnamed protein product [Strongylus vulgaris]|uniref:GOST seven transmembrane domain-containing protein n=1 Tax=Strongylus vulgaris TaxID=40348 RepID=A0A3P7IPA1_STRVU|nr:unnamed protein product [Strongylus vulgaris]